MRKMAQLYGNKPTGIGLKLEGRNEFDDWKGSFQPPSFLVKEQEVIFDGWVDVWDPYLGPVKARKFICNEEVYIDVKDRLGEEPQRCGTMAFWRDSYTEQLRKSIRIRDYISKTKIFRDLQALAKQYLNDFLDALLIYYEGILNDGDYSLDQFIRDLKDKEDSSSPFVYDNPFYKKNRDVLNSPELKTIFAREVKEEKAELTWLIEHLKLAKEGKYEFKLLDPNFLIDALRSRPVKLTYIVDTINKLHMEFQMYRARSAGGVVRVSRLSWPIWHTPTKKKILEKMALHLEKVFKIKLHLMDVESVAFYVSAFESQIECYDVSNAEKTWGCVFFPNMPGIVDFSLNEKFPEEFAPALQSGIDITRIINWFGALLIICWLRLNGKVSKDLIECWMGGDNFGGKFKLEKPEKVEGEDEVTYLTRLISVDDGLWHIIDTDDRILGFNAKLGRIGGLHHSIDGVDSMIAWNPEYNSFKWHQNRQTITRILDSVIQLDLYQKGTCIKFYKWILERSLISANTELYNHDDIWDVSKGEIMKEEESISETGVTKITNVEKLFKGITEWCEASFNVDNNVKGRFVAESDCTLSWSKVSGW